MKNQQAVEYLTAPQKSFGDYTFVLSLSLSSVLLILISSFFYLLLFFCLYVPHIIIYSSLYLFFIVAAGSRVEFNVHHLHSIGDGSKLTTNFVV